MGTTFWVRRFIVVFIGAFAVIGVAQLPNGPTTLHAVTEALVWAAVSSGIFIASRIYQSRKGKHCALCRDTPDMRDKFRG